MPTDMDSIYFPPITDEVIDALHLQLKSLQLLRQRQNQQLANLRIRIEQLEAGIEYLLECHDRPDSIRQKFKAYQAWGADRRGNVEFTGYFTPIVPVRKTPNGKYKYPIYRRPPEWEGPLPSRRAIDQDSVLRGQDLEIAYAADPVDIYYMQLQGSGFVKFRETGNYELLVYNGDNDHPYRSLGKHLARRDDISIGDISMAGIKRFLARDPAFRDTVIWINPSYVFFRPQGYKVKGAGQVELTEDVSIAADKRYFPLGSVLLATVPVFDQRGEITHHEFRWLLPQDTGGAIRGPGHVDLYCGIGSTGQEKASRYHHYGRMWMLLIE
jgi:membrane-bound lytic murein transglycosylase A